MANQLDRIERNTRVTAAPVRGAYLLLLILLAPAAGFLIIGLYAGAIAFLKWLVAAVLGGFVAH